MGFFYLQVVYIFVDVKHRVCKHREQEIKMQRLYERVDGKFIPRAWMCPDCGQVKTD